MTYKIHYDPQTTLVITQYPKFQYDRAQEPNIEISDAEYKRIFGDGLFQRPCVVNGVIQESQRPLEELLQEAKTSKLSQLAKNREFKAEKSFFEYNGKPYANSQNARIAINDARQSMETSTPSVSYFTYPTDEDGNLIASEREVVQFTKDDFNSLADLIRGNERLLRESEVALIIQITNCSTIEELNLINIEL